MTTETIIQILVPIIGIIAAIISASITYYFTKKNQLEATERKLKETFYLDYIQAISDSVVLNHTEKTKDKLADKQNQLLLIGSSDVVSCLMKFHDYVKPEGVKEHGFSNDIHDELLTDLLKAMRQDLYKDKRTNLDYPIIHLTGKAPRK